ncbi:hypothetical protein GE09DRAFT_1179227 [Coniochaeta sp. 2T2.1]|nr:hypothetical protein GE09DRAFT_1179227 [Coniochaeta sp. 2T2.1]
MERLFGSRARMAEVPGDRILPLHFFENSPLVQGNNMAASLVFDDVLDPEKLRDSLEGLVNRDGWRRLGGRLRKNAFTAERPAIAFSHVDHGVPVASQHAASRIPSPSHRPAVVGDPDDLADLAWEPGDSPGGIKDYLNTHRPVLGLRVNSFTDKTVVVLQWQHVAFDALGMQHVVEGWSSMLWGKEGEIPTPCNSDVDPFHPLADGSRPATETHVLNGRRVGLGGMLRWGLGYGVDMLLRAKENRMLRAEALEKGEDVSKVFLTENDILTAWTLRCAVAPMQMDSTGHVLATAGDVTSKPLSWLARQLRKAINEQGTRAQHEAYYEMVAKEGIPCRPSYVQENHGPIKPVDGFSVFGKDDRGNDWTSAYKVMGQWARFEEQLKADFENGV